MEEVEEVDEMENVVVAAAGVDVEELVAVKTPIVSTPSERAFRAPASQLHVLFQLPILQQPVPF